MGGVLAGLLGAPLTIYPGGGPGVAVTGRLRNERVEVLEGDGEPVLSSVTVLQITEPEAAGLVAGDTVVAGADTYKVRYQLPPESPASDRLLTFILDKV